MDYCKLVGMSVMYWNFISSHIEVRSGINAADVIK